MKSTLRPIVFVAFLATAAAYAADAAANWTQHCAKCHGDDGQGATKMGKKLKIRDLTDSAVQAKFTDEEAAKAMKVGVTDENGKTRMKAIPELSDAEITALIAHVRSLKK